MRTIWAVTVLGIVVGGYFAYQRPEVRVLFESTPRPENPLEFLENLPEPVVPPPRPSPRKPSAVPAPVVTADSPGSLESTTETEVTGSNQVPNDVVARTLMQILAARKLATGINISVSDSEVALHGGVASNREFQEICDIVEKAREYRRINTEHLSVGSR